MGLCFSVCINLLCCVSKRIEQMEVCFWDNSACKPWVLWEGVLLKDFSTERFCFQYKVALGWWFFYHAVRDESIVNNPLCPTFLNTQHWLACCVPYFRRNQELIVAGCQGDSTLSLHVGKASLAGTKWNYPTARSQLHLCHYNIARSQLQLLNYCFCVNQFILCGECVLS